MTERPPLPSIIDSTMLVTFRACPAKFHREFVLNRTASSTSTPLLAGGAFASGLEAYRRAYYADGYSKESALDIAFLAAISSWGDVDPFPQTKYESRSLDRVLCAIRDYFTTYPVDKDLFQPEIVPHTGQPTFEFSFSVPLDPDEHGFPVHPSHGEPFFWAGRSDGLGKYRNLSVFSDEKTTESLGASWAQKWLMRNQFISYAWCYREMGMPHRTALVRGVGLLKTKITHAEARVFYPDHLLNTWQHTAAHDLHQMVQMWEQDFWPERIGDSCTSWGNCQFTDVCIAHPKNKASFLATSYVERNWDPASTHNRRSALETAMLNA